MIYNFIIIAECMFENIFLVHKWKVVCRIKYRKQEFTLQSLFRVGYCIEKRYSYKIYCQVIAMHEVLRFPQLSWGRVALKFIIYVAWIIQVKYIKESFSLSLVSVVVVCCTVAITQFFSIILNENFSITCTCSPAGSLVGSTGWVNITS